MSDQTNRWRSRDRQTNDVPESTDESSVSRTASEESTAGASEQACREPTVDPLPAVPDDELSGIAYAIEQAGLIYYRGCRAVASTINRLKQMGD